MGRNSRLLFGVIWYTLALPRRPALVSNNSLTNERPPNNPPPSPQFRLMPEASVSTQTIPARRPRPEPEIIDVDAIPDDDILFTRVRSNPAQRRRMTPSAPQAAASSSNTREQPIVVYDSDEEVARNLAGECYLLPPPTAFSRSSQGTQPSCAAPDPW